MKKFGPLLLVLLGFAVFFATFDYSQLKLPPKVEEGYDFQLIRDEHLGEALLTSELVLGVNSVLISDKKGKLHLTKKDGQWVIFDQQSASVHQEKLEQLFKQFTTVKVKDVVSGSSFYYSSFGVAEKQETEADSQTVKLVLKKGEEVVLDLMLGNKNSKRGTNTFTDQYIRFCNEKTVYLVVDELSLSSAPESWSQKTK